MTAAPTTRDLTKELTGVHALTNWTAATPLRKEALSHFQRLGFPGSRHEEYRFTPITKSLEKIISVNEPNHASSAFNIDDYRLPGLNANYIVLVNGSYNETLSSIISPADQLLVLPLAKALEEKAHLTDCHFGKHVDFTSDGFSAYNTAFWRDGIFIHVPEKKNVNLPIVILHLSDGQNSPATSVSRLLLIAEPDSHVELIQRFETKGTAFSSWVEEVVVGERAQVNYYKIQNDAGASYHVASTLIHQSDKSRVNTFTITLDGKMIRNNFGIAIDGERCESHFYGLYLLHKDTLADNHTVVDHRKPNSFSNQLYKGVLADNSKGIFNGKIYVRRHAQKTNAFQSNRNVLLTDTAVIHTKPQLEIWADDVKCSHGCTSGQLDDEAMFYLQSRGISKENAQALLLYAFAGEVLDTIQNEPVRNYMTSVISNRLNHEN